ncbi:MAG: AAA family ATPase [bacterium]|nr:AAA family ATPase [bacterium]
MDTLIEIYHRLLIEIIPSYHRKFYDDFTMDNRLIGIIGARGVGKTTFLIDYLRKHYDGSNQALYISADNLYFVEHTLLEIVDQFVKDFDGQLLCIDEIHRYKNWNQELKNIYDSYPKLSVIFSGSSSIDLIKGKYDLSRRAILKTMYGFSFREFLEIHEKKKYSIIKLSDLYQNAGVYSQKLAKIPKLLGLFKQYLREGYYPTFLEMGSYEAYSYSLRGIVDKIIYQDVSSFYSLNTSNLDTLKKIIYFFATSQPGSVNVNRLAGSLKKDHTTISEYVQILRDTGLLRFLLQNKQGHALVRDAEKIYVDNTNLLFALNKEIGKEPLIGLSRELFVISNLQNAAYRVFFSKQADVECEDAIFEIGGKSKTSSQLKGKKGYLVKDDILIGGPGTIPLYLFGFLS